MKSFKSIVIVAVAVLFGVVLGVFLARPSKVYAGVGVRMQKVNEGYNLAIGADYLGFACTQQDCYVLTR